MKEIYHSLGIIHSACCRSLPEFLPLCRIVTTFIKVKCSRRARAIFGREKRLDSNGRSKHRGSMPPAEDSLSPLKTSKPKPRFTVVLGTLERGFCRARTYNIFKCNVGGESTGGVGHDSSFDTTVARDERIVIPMEAQKHQSGVVRSPSQQTSRFSSLSMSSSLDDT